MTSEPDLEQLLDAFDRADVDVARTRAVLEELSAAAGAFPRTPVAVVTDSQVAGVGIRSFRPGAPGGLRLVWAHGGGWVAGTLDVTDPLCRALAAASGLEVVAVDYRLAPEHPFPAALEDLLAVLAGLDGPLAVGGDSVGGGLAAAAAQRHPGPLAAQLLVSPLLDATLSSPSIRELATGHGLTRRVLEQYAALYLAGADPSDPRASPLLTADLRGLPPAVIVTGGRDPLKDEGAAYAARLGEAGVRAVHRNWPLAVHGFFGMSGPTPVEDEALRWAVGELAALVRA